MLTVNLSFPKNWTPCVFWHWDISVCKKYRCPGNHFYFTPASEGNCWHLTAWFLQLFNALHSVTIYSRFTSASVSAMCIEILILMCICICQSHWTFTWGFLFVNFLFKKCLESTNVVWMHEIKEGVSEPSLLDKQLRRMASLCNMECPVPPPPKKNLSCLFYHGHLLKEVVNLFRHGHHYCTDTLNGFLRPCLVIVLFWSSGIKL